MKILRILGIQKSKYFIEISRVKPGVTAIDLWWVASHAKSNFDDLNEDCDDDVNDWDESVQKGVVYHLWLDGLMEK